MPRLPTACSRLNAEDPSRCRRGSRTAGIRGRSHPPSAAGRGSLDGAHDRAGGAGRSHRRETEEPGARDSALRETTAGRSSEALPRRSRTHVGPNRFPEPSSARTDVTTKWSLDPTPMRARAAERQRRRRRGRPVARRVDTVLRRDARANHLPSRDATGQPRSTGPERSYRTRCGGGAQRFPHDIRDERGRRQDPRPRHPRAPWGRGNHGPRDASRSAPPLRPQARP